jgi:hypothetical protein
MRPSDEATIERKLFTARRTDLACDRNRAISRLRGTLTSMFPALERTLELTTKGPGDLVGPARPRRASTQRRWVGVSPSKMSMTGS